MKLRTLLSAVLLVCVNSMDISAQVCNPTVAPSGLNSTYTPGSGALLQWDVVPGSIGVQIKATSPSGSDITRRIVGFERDQLLVPDALLTPGTYNWQVQAACSITPPYSATPISISNSFTVGSASTCPATVTDVDGNIYNTVEVGTQCWTAENLKVERYRNGDAIPTGLDFSAWTLTTSGAFAVYSNDAANKNTYGLLYNWFATIDARGLCPSGWHVPTDEEWTNLIVAIDPSACTSSICQEQSDFAAGPLKATGTLEAGTGLWQTPNAGATNSTGFSALPGGKRSAGIYRFIGSDGYWWSSTESLSTDAWYRIFVYPNSGAYRYDIIKQEGLSVRCIQD